MFDLVEATSKAKTEILNDLLFDINDGNIEKISHVKGLIENYKEMLERHLNIYMENKSE